MKNFTHRRKSVEFWKISGEVIGSNKFSETHVSSSGGGGYIGQHGGHVTAPTVRSETVTNHEFWIKTEDGLEKDIKLRGIDVPLRSGQKITLISAGIKGTNKGWYSILVNHSAGKHWFINSAEELNKTLKIEVITGKSLIVAIAIFLGICYFTGPSPSWELALVASGVFFLFRVVTKLRRVTRLKTKLKSHLEQLAQSTYQRA